MKISEVWVSLLFARDDSASSDPAPQVRKTSFAEAVDIKYNSFVDKPLYISTSSRAEYMAHLSIKLMGSFQVTLDDDPVAGFDTDKTRALLSYLAVERHHPIRRDSLAGLLWAERPSQRARHSLRQSISNLRQAIGDQDQEEPFLLVSRHTVQLNPAADCRLDVTEFLSLDQANRSHRHHHIERCLPCIQRMEAMAKLYGGDFLRGFFVDECHAFEEWASLQREHLHRLMMEVLEILSAYHERRGDLAQAIHHARRQVQAEPWHEETHRQLMHLLAKDGQRSAALAQYRDCQRQLAEELGVKPTDETTALFIQIQEQAMAHSGRTARHAPLPSRLPVPSTPLVGRERELAELAGLLAEPGCRLVTLTGPGGIGKTRLALQVASEHVGLFAQGVVFVPLADVRSADLIAPTLAIALHFRLHGQDNPEQQILDFLREKQMLLVLDNMEHLLDGGTLVSGILRHSPEITILVTSRERLRLREEWVFEVSGLTCPPQGELVGIELFGAVSLFAQIASRSCRTFSLTEEIVPPLARICRLVDGMPLAIELAAAWIPLYSCDQIARDLEDNLAALETPLRDMPERHASLRAVFEHSWQLLSEDHRASLRKLSLFRGGFEESIAWHVAGADAAALAALVAKSLVHRDAAGRYEMHRLVREYAAEKLRAHPCEQQATEDRLVAFYARFLDERESWFRGPRQAEASHQIGLEIENVRLAWRLATALANSGAIRQSLWSLGAFYSLRSWHLEGAHVFSLAATTMSSTPSRPADDPLRDLVLGSVSAWQGHFEYQLGQYELAQQLLDQSLELVRRHGASRELAFGLYTRALILCFGLNEYQQAQTSFQESLTGYEALDDSYGRALALDGLGDVAARIGDHDRARTHYTDSLALRRQIGDRWGISISLGSLGGLAGRQGAYEDARRWFEESLQIARDLDNPRGIATCLHNLSTIAYLREEYTEAKRLRQETLAICRQIGFRWGTASALKSLGDVASRLGEYQEARQYLLQSLSILEESGDRRSQAYTLCSLGTVAERMGHHAESRRHLMQALAAAMEIHEPALALDILHHLAQLASTQGDREQAMELVILILYHPACEQQTRAKTQNLRAALISDMPASVVAAAEARGLGVTLDEVTSRVLGQSGK